MTNRPRKKRNVPVGVGFTGADKENNLKEFLASEAHQMLWERLEETKQRLPWTRGTVDSLKAHVERTGEMTVKQKGFATSLYIDACVTTDERLTEQVETRKLGYRLMDLELGRVRSLVIDIMYHTSKRPFSMGQARAFKNIAKQQCVKLTHIPKLTNKEFDGWFLIDKEILGNEM